MEEQLLEGFEADIKNFITQEVHAYMRNLLGDTVFIFLSSLFIFLGIALLVASIANSNILFGDPSRRDRSQLGDIEYLKTRRILRIVVGIVGFILIIYNILGLIAD